MLSSSFHASIFAQKTKIYTNMATREQKNTISNLFKLRVAEELRDNPDKEFYALNEEKEIFKTKVLRRIIEDTQPPVNLWQGLWYQGEMACLFGIPLFIMCGFVHSIADAFYYTLALLPGDWTGTTLLVYLASILGNFIGCNLYRTLQLVAPKK